MAVDLGTCVGTVAPMYNLALVTVAIILFIVLFRSKKKNLTPWKFFFAAIMIYVVEEVITVLNKIDLISTPRILNSYFEMAIVTIFIYVLLKQKEVIKKKR